MRPPSVSSVRPVTQRASFGESPGLHDSGEQVQIVDIFDVHKFSLDLLAQPCVGGIGV
jgi:hypothetical protein